MDMTINPVVGAIRPSKTMVLSDLATSLRESGVDVISLAAGEPDFDTPEPVAEAGIQAIRHASYRLAVQAKDSMQCVLASTILHMTADQ